MLRKTKKQLQFAVFLAMVQARCVIVAESRFKFVSARMSLLAIVKAARELENI
jgi:hypothetical protein